MFSESMSGSSGCCCGGLPESFGPCSAPASEQSDRPPSLRLRSASVGDDAFDAQEQLSELQDKLEVSCQWALDLEADLGAANARAQAQAVRCDALEAALRERDEELSSAPLCLTPRPLR